MSQNKRELLPEQAAAAYEIKNHVSVTAGPGSGKTTVLVERYLHILRQHKLSIDQIVAITFTNRAANEMRERLRSELNSILRSAEPTERRHWLSYKRTLDGAVITTIHGFCARLLKEFPIEARVDPQFLLLDEHRAAMLLDATVEEVLSEFITNGHVEISRLTLGLGRSRLAASLAQLYREVRGQGVPLDQLALKTAGIHAKEVDLHVSLGELDAAMAAFLAVRRTTEKSKQNHAEVSSAWPNFRELLQQIPEHDTLADYCQTIDSFRNLRPGLRGSVVEQVKVLDELVWGKELGGRIPQICLDLFAGTYALEIVSVLTRIHERLNEEKYKLSALDFDDLETRTIDLLELPEVIARVSERYKFFLVDEFQDTNALQRTLLEKLALSRGQRTANLFIVGDRKQSVYGFRGADVDVFREMTSILTAAGGIEVPLRLNFRSQPPLIHFFNLLFARLFKVPEDSSWDEVKDLGYVEHEDSEPRRESRDEGPLVELLVSTTPTTEEDPEAETDSRELDALQVARRINSLMKDNQDLKYCDFALLFRAMTNVQIYESTFRRENIPYQTVLGRGFYEREEISDLIQLLRFLDNKTDELALAAVLRSPLCGLSDNALLALRCAPKTENGANDPLKTSTITRSLFTALRQHHSISFISTEEHELLDRAAKLIHELITRRHHYTIENLLRFAVHESEYMTVIAANFDGAQRLANVQRLFTLAARFERSGNYLIRDFVRYVEEFEAIGSRESEGQIDEAANAVRLMTIHQAKGLEFPIVVIPDLQRLARISSDVVFLLDRNDGLTLKVPDGRGKQVTGLTYELFERRQVLREEFEGTRLLYVAATRAQDRLILSGAVDELKHLNGKPDSWLKTIWQALELQDQTSDGLVDLGDDVQLQLTFNLKVDEGQRQTDSVAINEPEELSDNLTTTFPLLEPVASERDTEVYRFSVTQLINYQRCPRQYYFDRVLKLPSAEEVAVWNSAEAPEPPANLTATLKGAVIHRFCELYQPGEDEEIRLRESFLDIVRLRQAELGDRLFDIQTDVAVKELLPLAQNYLGSQLFQRINSATFKTDEKVPINQPGLWSELSFRLRRPNGILTGTIDKLLITQLEDGSLKVEIIDFKTNRIPRIKETPKLTPVVETVNVSQKTRKSSSGQFSFDFENSVTLLDQPDTSTTDPITSAALDYKLQMQAYALAVKELLPITVDGQIIVTLHFLEPNVEFQLPPEMLLGQVCAEAIDESIREIVSSSEPADFPVNPASHCRMCNFLNLCPAGQRKARVVSTDTR